MHFYLYEIKNKINGKIYVGVHKTKNLDDGYMGSGKLIKAAIEKYGIQSFTKTILETFSSQDEMFSREQEIVNEEFLARDDVYNLRRGGMGGFDHINKLGVNFGRNIPGAQAELSRRAVESSKILRLDPVWNKFFSDAVSASQKKYANEHKNEKIELAKLGNLASRQPTSIAKRVAKFKEIGHMQGEKNSQFGTMWITNGTENKKIKKDTLIPEGWNKGRSTKIYTDIV